MKLLELTPAEIAFLSSPPSVPDEMQARLTRRLGAMLTARMHWPVHVQAQTGLAATNAAARPCWQPDPALATLWLTRRLGGQRVAGVASFVPRSLIQNLDEVLAECWLDVASPAALPPALAWHIEADSTHARLVVQLPRHSSDMTRWAREVIQHG